MQKPKTHGWWLALWFMSGLWLVVLWGSAPPTAVAESNTFGSGLNTCTAPVSPVSLQNPTVVTNCTRAGVQAALDIGGHIRFACGENPVTIAIDQTLQTNGQDTVLDGGGLVTLDGLDQVRILEKPYTAVPTTLTIQNMRFVRGRAPSGNGTGDHSGGAIKVGDPGTRVHIINSTFEENATRDVNKTDNQGGAIFAANLYEVVISGSTFANNAAGNGGAYGGIATGLLIYNSRFTSNTAVDDTSGGIVRGYGGAVHLDGVRNSYNPDSRREFTVCGSVFEQNTAVRGGGALSSVVSDGYNTKVSLERNTFNQNSVSGLAGEFGQGGAFYHVEDDQIGGRAEDNLLISQNTFYQNEAGRSGGAVWVYVLGRGEVVNNTFAENRTTAGFNKVGQGGAMMIVLGNIDIINSTFANNHADYQGGAIHGGGGGNADRVITLSNTIFVDNTLNIGQTEPSETRWQGFHTNRPLADGGQNIQFPEKKPTYDNAVNNNITAVPIYANPQLGALADNGGFNRTLLPSANSPAVDNGHEAHCPAVDQRDFVRVGPCDIGAVELAGEPFAPVVDLYLPLIQR